MTNHELAQEFEVINPRLEQLTSYVGASSLLTAVEKRAPRSSGYVLAAEKPHAGGKPAKYDEAIRDQARVMRRDGLKLIAIAARLHMPLATVHNIVQPRSRR